MCNAGANTTTYVLPSEVFPTRVRATFHGISAACMIEGAERIEQRGEEEKNFDTVYLSSRSYLSYSLLLTFFLAGKLGAVVGAASMAFLVNTPNVVFFLCGITAFRLPSSFFLLLNFLLSSSLAGVAISGAVLTFFCVEETMGKSLSDLNDENETEEEQSDSQNILANQEA